MKKALLERIMRDGRAETAGKLYRLVIRAGKKTVLSQRKNVYGTAHGPWLVSWKED